MQRYNVYIIETATGEAVALIGKNLNESGAEKRIITGLGRIDRDNFFVAEIEVGSKQDLELIDNLKQ